MSKCIKVLGMLMEMSGLCVDDKRKRQQVVLDHVQRCESCSMFWSALNNSVMVQGSKSQFGGRLRQEEGLANSVLLAELTQMDVRSISVTNIQGIGTETEGKFFTLFVDGQEFHIEQSTITGGEIMDLAGIPREVGLIMVEEDGTQVPVAEDDVVELKPGRRFKKAPRFIRG